MRADLTVFDYERIEDGANWEQPTAAPAGIDYVVVNGEVTLDAERLHRRQGRPGAAGRLPARLRALTMPARRAVSARTAAPMKMLSSAT